MNNIFTSINNWNTNLYEDKHAFVWQYGEDLLKLLNPQSGERILDLGCGTGQLTAKIAAAGVETAGIDSAATMIEKAKQNYQHIQFDIGDATKFAVEKPLDAVFSNAVLHWIKQPDAVISCVYKALKPGGRFVAEFGGKGNVKAITTALEDMGISPAINPWYFPSIGEYATRLEQQGFNVKFAALFARPTPLQDGDTGLANWLQMFASKFLTELSIEEQQRVIDAVEERLKPQLYYKGTWTADYCRIRIVAVKS